MKGLYISFVIKRRKKIDKIMDYFLAIALGMILFTFGFYLQFVGAQNKYASSSKEKMTLETSYEQINESVEASKIENATAIELTYNETYKELETMSIDMAKYSGYIDDFYTIIKGDDGEEGTEDDLKGVSISGVKLNPAQGKIYINLQFDTSQDAGGPDIAVKFRALVYDLSWVPNNAINAPDDKNSTRWEVSLYGSTIEDETK